MNVGLLTIGQSPRTDVVPELRAAIHQPVDFVEKGVLDGVDEAELSRWAPRAGVGTLVSRLKRSPTCGEMNACLPSARQNVFFNSAP